MTNPTPNSLSPQGVPSNSARCLGSGSYEDGKWYWREGCDDCQRRYGWAGGWIDPPPIIAFECEYRIGPDKNAAQGEHEPVPEPLSASAQKVLDAATAPTGSFCLENVNEIAAAAIRELADQIAPTKQDYEEASHGLATVFLNGVAYAVNEMRLIATELEAQSQ